MFKKIINKLLVLLLLRKKKLKKENKNDKTNYIRENNKHIDSNTEELFIFRQELSRITNNPTFFHPKCRAFFPSPQTSD